MTQPTHPHLSDEQKKAGEEIHLAWRGALKSCGVSEADRDAIGEVVRGMLNSTTPSTAVNEQRAEAALRQVLEAVNAYQPKADSTEPKCWKLVPLQFLQGFSTLSHNYSLNAQAPDYYHGVERDAFSAAYRRCGQSLAELRAMLDATPSPVNPASAQPGGVVISDGDYARLAEKAGAAMSWLEEGAEPPSFQSWEVWGRFCDEVRALRPKAQPLTDEQIDIAAESADCHTCEYCDQRMHAFARAIEAAHGIASPTKGEGNG